MSIFCPQKLTRCLTSSEEVSDSEQGHIEKINLNNNVSAKYVVTAMDNERDARLTFGL